MMKRCNEQSFFFVCRGRGDGWGGGGGGGGESLGGQL